MFIRIGDLKNPEYKGIKEMSAFRLHQDAFELLRLYLKKGMHILDFGCGQGAFSQRLIDEGMIVDACDLNTAQIQAKVNNKISLDLNKEINPALFSKQYDIVIALEILEHLENPWKYLRDCKALLKDDGIILLSTPNISNFVSRLRFFMRGTLIAYEKTDLVHGHITPLSFIQIENLCNQLQIEIVRKGNAGPIPLFHFYGISLFSFFRNSVLPLLYPFMSGPKKGRALVYILRKKDKMDFASFYDKQPDYAAFREDPSRSQDYDIISDWKVRKLIQLIPSDFEAKHIIEVGCAFGVLLNNIANRLQIKSRIGVDISGKNIEVAAKLFPDCVFFQGTFEEFISKQPELNDSKFDLVVLSDIIEHLPDDEGFLKTIKNYSSFVLLNLPLEKSFSTRNRQYGEQDPSGHLRCYDLDLAIKLVKKAGFEIVESFTATNFFDKQFYEVYKKNRSVRVRKKSFAKRIFWTVYYTIQDKLKRISGKITDKIYGTNYFALLKG